jgi:hypothetical protein
MAKPTAPLFGFEARGQIGKTLVYANWRGVRYVRERVVPTNPQSPAQMDTRAVFSWLNDYYKNAPALGTAPWEAAALGQPFTGRNKLLSVNVPLLRSQTDITALVFSPGANGGPALDSISAAPGSAAGSITATATPPSPPPGWTIQAVVFLAIPQQDPHGPIVLPISALEDTTSPYSVTFTGLEAGQEYVVGAYPRWQRPDGRQAYGPSLSTTANAQS